MLTASNFRLCWQGSYPNVSSVQEIIHGSAGVTQYLAQNFSLRGGSGRKPSGAFGVRLSFGCSSTLNTAYVPKDEREKEEPKGRGRGWGEEVSTSFSQIIGQLYSVSLPDA